MIKYKFAIDKNNSITDILDINQDNKDIYYCPSCGNELIAKVKDKKRTKHFAHKNLEVICSKETYLHFLAKQILYNAIQEKIISKRSLFLEYTHKVFCGSCFFQECKNSKCEFENATERFNLLSIYNSVELEMQFGDFQPDICVFNDNDKIFIEMVVTHKVDLKKILSKNKIIEIYIKSEEQLNALKSDIINNDVYKTELYNFRFKDKFKKINENECIRKIEKFLLFKDGKSIIMSLNIIEYKKIKQEIVYENDVNEKLPFWESYIQNVQLAYERNKKIRNCHICRYHGYVYEFHELTAKIFCKYYKEEVENSNRAVVCEIFYADKNSYYSKQKTAHKL